MDVFYATEIVVPMPQITLLLILSTLALLFGRMKLALLMNYIFTLYWGYIANRDYLLGHAESAGYFLFAYFGFGLAVVVIALVGFLSHTER